MGSKPDSSTEGDSFEISMIFILVEAILNLGRMWMDIFILTVNCREWMKKKRLSPTERILTLQGSIRICLGCMTMVIYFMNKLQKAYIAKGWKLAFWCFVSCNIWLTVSLCSYYCVKIANFGHPFFVHLKLRLSRWGSTWLLGSAILSLASSLPLVVRVLQIQGNRDISNFFQNENVTNMSLAMMEFHRDTLLGLGYLPALSICVTSAVMLLFSLWRHRQRMLGSWNGHRSPQADAHFRAVITILSVLINHVILIVSSQLLISSGLKRNLIAHHSVAIVLCLSLLVEPLISIWGNKQLKNKFLMCLSIAKHKGCVS